MASTPLNALHAFLAVARRGSFASAATELGISTSALSQSVRALEERLGVPLLSRTTRSVALTEAGRRMVAEAGPAIAQALEAIRGASERADEIVGRVRLTVPPIALKHVVEPVLPRFVAAYPKVEVDVQVENRRADIVAEGFDAGIRLEEYLARDVVKLRLSEPFRFVVAASPAYLARHGEPRDPKDLLSHSCVCYRSPTTGAVFRWELERGKKLLRVPVSGSITTNDEALAIRMAEASVGPVYAYEPSVLESIRKGRLRIVLEAYAAKVPGFFLFYPSRARVSPAFRAFIETARSVLRRPTKAPN